MAAIDRWVSSHLIKDAGLGVAVPKPRPPQNLRTRTIKRRYRLFMLAEVSNPFYRVSRMEILGLPVLVLTVAHFL